MNGRASASRRLKLSVSVAPPYGPKGSGSFEIKSTISCVLLQDESDFAVYFLKLRSKLIAAFSCLEKYFIRYSQ